MANIKATFNFTEKQPVPLKYEFTERENAVALFEFNYSGGKGGLDVEFGEGLTLRNKVVSVAPATDDTLGGIKAGENVEIRPDGTLNVSTAPGIWGKITGDISNQLDLQSSLAARGDGLRYEDNFLYLTSNGEDISEGIYITGGGGETPEFWVTTDMPLTQYYSKDDRVIITCNFRTEGRLKRATAQYIINNIPRASKNVLDEGDFSQDISEYLKEGSNTLEVKVTDAYNSVFSLFFTINVVVLSLSSTFDDTLIYTGDVTFRYTPMGEVTKTIHFLLDGVETTETVSASGRQQTKVFQVTNGGHSLKVWATATLGSATIRSNEVYYEFVRSDGTSPVLCITSDFQQTSCLQGETISIPYMVYSSQQLTCPVEVYINDELVSELVVDRAKHIWQKALTDPVETEIKFVSGTAEKSFTINVEEVQIDVHPVTENLELFLTAAGRSNYDIDREVWHYNDIYCTLSGFNFVTDGWMNNALKVSGGAHVEIPFMPFKEDFRASGKTIEIEFSTSNVLDYDSIVLDCMSGNRGIQVTAQNSTLKSEQSQVSTKFKEDEKIRIAFVIEDRSSYRLIYTYLNGIISGLAQYPTDDDFHQLTPVGISIGSNTCDVNIYNIRVYNSYLSRYDVLNNYIADTADVLEKLDLYTRNNIYDEYNNIIYSKVLKQVPIMTITGDLPASKGDKKKITVSYENEQEPERNFTMSNVTFDIQGTSSQYYPKKNYKISKLPESYALRAGSIAEKVFTMKADYMESSHAHNTGLAKFINQIYSDKTPAQLLDPKARTTIDGFPIAIYYRATEEETPEYFGVYNFNNDKESNNNWGFTSGCESWEWSNNTSDRCLFKSDDFRDKEGVLTDFEARYPSDYEDTTKLHALVSWVHSCDSEEATGQAIAPVTIEGVTYTTDSEEYRKAKFRSECEGHFNLNYLLTYYIISEFFGGIDSRCKNMFMNNYGGSIWYPVFYDIDSVIGLNNEGVNDFSFNIEYHDIIGTEHVFNGEKSVLWNMVERCFLQEVTDLYNSLRNDGRLTYDTVMHYLKEEQIDKICEAQYNEDAAFKYISPLTEEGIATYLYTAQGSRVNHIKWWIFNRFHYMDSKYIASDYKDNYMTLRLYTPRVWEEVEPDATITLTSYISQYLRVKYGAYDVYQRAQQNVPTEIVPPPIEFNDTETIIYGANKILSIGDLAPLYAGTIDVSKATKLSELKIGHGGSYQNTNLKSLALGNNTMLKSLDIRNCPSLTGALDISGCQNILEIKATGTSLTSVKLAEAGSIEILELPNTIVNLTIKNQNNLETFVCGYENVATLVIENCSLDTQNIFGECEALTKVRLTGIDWTLGSSFDNLDRAYNMLGQDEAGYNLPHGVLSGVVRMNNVKLSVVDEYKKKFLGLEFIVENPLEEDYVYTDFGEVITTADGDPLLYTNVD